jgi:hypothetical protein
LAFKGSPLKMKVVMKKIIEWNREEEMKKGNSRDESSRKQLLDD